MTSIRVFVAGTSGQIGSSIQNKLSKIPTLEIKKDCRLNVLVIAAGTSNSRLTERDMFSELERFQSFVDKCEFSKYSRVVLISSGGSVYGEDSSQVIYEETLENPATPYGRLKLECENLVEHYSNQYDFQLLVTRFANVYSSKLSGILGALLKSSESDSEFRILSRIDSVKQYGHVDDYSEVLLNLVSSCEFWLRAPKVYCLNVFSPLSYSIGDLITIIENATDRKVKYDAKFQSHLRRNSIVLGTRDKILQDIISNFPWRSVGDFLRDEIEMNPRTPYLRREDYR